MDKAAARVKAACPLLSDKIIAHRMKQPTPLPPAKPQDDRAARLAEALRVNLHRRKAQARAAAPPKADEPSSDQ